ncbi:MAG: GTPase [Eubacterium sp.]|nr:GTPase [Eubacterium sp.]
MSTVYFINGFLEAGKTSFIRDLLSKDYFQIDGRTLLLVCEEGDTEYDVEELEAVKTDIEYISDPEDFTEGHLTYIEKKYRPERIIVEFNGMWNRKNLEFPWYWGDFIEVAIFDALTFKLYSDNMRALLAEQVRNADIVVFNRCDSVRKDIGRYTRNIKAINSKAAFIYLGKEGNITLDPDETLPYDINEDELFLDDRGFAVFCMDSMERYGIYEGKVVHFSAMAYQMRNGQKFEFVAGRHIMTCCELDMSFVGIICSYIKSYKLENKSWVYVTAVVKISYDDDLKKYIPICRVIDLSECEEPGNPIVSLI